MTDTTLVPPSMPKKSSGGFLKRLFSKNTTVPPPPSGGMEVVSKLIPPPPEKAATLSVPPLLQQDGRNSSLLQSRDAELSREVVQPADLPDLNDAELENIKRKLGLSTNDLPGSTNSKSPAWTVEDIGVQDPKNAAPASPEPASNPWVVEVQTEPQSPQTSDTKPSWIHDSFSQTEQESKDPSIAKTAVQESTKEQQTSDVVASVSQEQANSTDWTKDLHHGEQLTSDKQKTKYQEAVEKHLAELEKHHERVSAKIEQLTGETPEIPDWHVQDQEVAPYQYFILHNGQPIRSMKELLRALEYIDDATFNHHVTSYRNDFANWIRDVIGNEKLSILVQEATDRDSIASVLRNNERMASKALVKDTERLQQVVQKRKDALKKLGTVEQQIASLKAQLDEKSKQLSVERSQAARTIKERLDQELALRLADERASLAAAKKEVQQAKADYLLKSKEYDGLVASIADREKAVMLKETSVAQKLQELEEQRAQFTEQFKQTEPLMRNAEQLRKQFEQMKLLDVQSKKNLEEISRKEIALSRAEETLRQREAKVAQDLARITAEQEKIVSLQSEHHERVLSMSQAEEDAKKIIADAERRAQEAVEQERVMKAKMQEEQKSIDEMRQQIEKALAKALGEKKKLTKAVELRKYLEQSMLQAKYEVAGERRELEREGFDSYVKSTIASTPVGQPASSAAEEVLAAGRHELPIYAKVEACRAALEQGDLARARSLYAQLRDEFGALPVSSDRGSLYTSIRELYDDIHLAMLRG